MANPLQFTPPPVDPRLHLMRRLEGAPREHAEALLVGYDILEAAHRNGTLDLVHGLVSGRDIIAGKLAEYGKLQLSENALRNLIAALRVLGSLEPETVESVMRALAKAAEQHKKEIEPPSLFQIARRIFSADSRRALSFATLTIMTLGRGLREG